MAEEVDLFVIGAGSGGVRAARISSGYGARVMIADVTEDVGKETAAGLAGGGFVKLDVTDDGGWEAAITQTVAELGGLDVVVNNAGVEVTQLLVDTDPDDVRKMLEVNILGTMLGIKHGLRAMRPGGAAGAGAAESVNRRRGSLPSSAATLP